MNRLRYFAGVARGLSGMLRAPKTGDPETVIRDGVEHRAETFLELMRRAVFANPSNPYARMFKLADCGVDDLARLVDREGLERALATLHRSGVYLTHDEFKLKCPIVRGGEVFEADASTFTNPLSKGGLVGQSGGSRSRGTRVQMSTAARVYRDAYDQLIHEELGLTGCHHVLLKPILPAVDGITFLVRAHRLGCTLDRWFSPVAKTADSAHYFLGTRAVVLMARAHGARLPVPTDLPSNDFSPVARWLAAQRARGIRTAITTYASPAARACAAASELGLSLDGSTFLVGGETLTDAKRRVIESTGARVFTRYNISELGQIGHACRHMAGVDSVHLFTDSLAVIPHRRPAPFSDAPLDSLLFTSLRLHAAYALVNVEMDDGAVIAEAPSCDCRFGRLGLTTVLRDIYAFGKLTGHGVTLVGTDLLRILERVLPARFGGSATDYQLVEHDGANQARLTLRVSRRVPVHSIDALRDGFLQELRACHGGQIASRLWRDADALDVVHEDPLLTPKGKVLSLHVLGSGSAGPRPVHGS